jgi:hypothetical protein
MKRYLIAFIILNIIFLSSCITTSQIGNTDNSKEFVKAVPEGIKGYPIKLNGKYGFIDKNSNILMKPVVRAQEIGDYSTDKIVFMSFDFFEILDNTAGNVIIPHQDLNYEEISEFKQGLARVKRSGRYGFINTEGKLVIGLQFHNADSFSEDLAAVKIEDKWGYIDKSGEMIVAAQFDYCGGFSGGLAAFKKNNRFGFLDKTGRIMVEPKYDECYSFKDDLAIVVKAGKRGFINKDGQEIIPVQYEYVDSFHDGLAAMEMNGKHGYLDKKGKIVIQPVYDSASSYSEGLAVVWQGGHSSVIDTSGKVVIVTDYNYIDRYSEGYNLVYKNKKYGFVDKKGSLVIDYQFDYAYKFSEGLAAVRLDRKWGYINTTGKIVIPLQFDRCSSFINGRAKVWVNNRCGIIDKTGAYIISPGEYNEIYESTDAPMIARIDGKSGLVDSTGAIIMEPAYDEISGYSDSCYRVKLDYKCGLIDAQSLKPVHELHFECIEALDDLAIYKDTIRIEAGYSMYLTEIGNGKLCYFLQDNKYGLIDDKGNIIIQPRFERLIGFNDALTRVAENGKWGLIDSKSGKIILEPQYLEINDYKEGLAAFKKATKYKIVKQADNGSQVEFDTETGTDIELWGFMDGTGKVIMKPQYSRVGNFSEGICFASEFAGISGTRLLFRDVCINKNGAVLFAVPYFDTIWTEFCQGVIIFEKGKKYGLIDKKGKVILSPEFDKIDFFTADSVYACFEKDGKFGLLSNTGKIIIEPQYDDIIKLTKSFSAAQLDGKYYIISHKTGKRQSDFGYDYIYAYTVDDLHKFVVDGKQGYFDLADKIIIKAEYEYLGNFVEGLAPMRRDNKYGYIDKKGEEVIPPQFDSADYFDDGIACVSIANRFGYINTKGEYVWIPTE